MKRYKDFIAEGGRCWPGHKPVPGKKPYSPGSCVKEETLDEMDKSAPQPGRDGKVSHSTYGSRDKKGSDYFAGKEAPGKPVTAKQASKDALDILKKQGVAEDIEQVDEGNKENKAKKNAYVASIIQKKLHPSVLPSLAYGRKELKKEEVLEEGRPSQRHPLEGHEYHKKTDAQLVYIAKDAHKAAEAMKGHNTQAENKYRDQANDSATVRYWRQKNGMPDWYRKKYGHIKEEVEQVDEVAAWQRKEGKNPEGGLNRKGIESYRRENPGSKLSMAVTTKPSKLKPGSKAANRRKSFCARMGGMKKRLTSAKTANDPDSRINKALRKWNC